MVEDPAARLASIENCFADYKAKIDKKPSKSNPLRKDTVPHILGDGRWLIARIRSLEADLAAVSGNLQWMQKERDKAERTLNAFLKPTERKGA